MVDSSFRHQLLKGLNFLIPNTNFRFIAGKYGFVGANNMDTLIVRLHANDEIGQDQRSLFDAGLRFLGVLIFEENFGPIRSDVDPIRDIDLLNFVELAKLVFFVLKADSSL
jgi:hypothetical protein